MKEIDYDEIYVLPSSSDKINKINFLGLVQIGWKRAHVTIIKTSNYFI